MKIPIYSKLKNAKTTLKNAERMNNRSIKKLEDQRKKTSFDLDKLGKLELEILDGFKEFVELHNRLGITSSFAQFTRDNAELPPIDLKDLMDTASGANILLNSLESVASGVVGGFATYGAITTAALHTAISAIRSAASIPVVHLASGASLAGIGAVGSGALASGAITAGGSLSLASGIIATGTGATLGSVAMSAAGPVGLIVGGTIMCRSASKLSKKADKAYEEAQKTKREIDKICRYLVELSKLSNGFYESVLSVNLVYKKHWLRFKNLVNGEGKNLLIDFSEEEKLLTQNLYLLVQLLYHMCRVNLVLEKEQDGLNVLNADEVNRTIASAKNVLESVEA